MVGLISSAGKAQQVWDSLGQVLLHHHATCMCQAYAVPIPSTLSLLPPFPVAPNPAASTASVIPSHPIPTPNTVTPRHTTEGQGTGQ